MEPTILVVDDQSAMRSVLCDYLTEVGYSVYTAGHGREAMVAARRLKPDLILLDIVMPQMDGLEFLRSYRQDRNTPVILLTARGAEADKVLGLELGADDYVTKPFGMPELVARIRAVLRRLAQVHPAEVLRAADIVLDRGQHRVEVGGRVVSLTPTEFELLAVLMAASGRAFTRSQLLDRLQGFSVEAVERTVDVHVRHLRAKIELDAAKPRYIQTVFGVGYRFNAD
jgi:two-component system, OmpR family, alkaline phosphatase synthesis response regulator PhoP